MARTFTQKHYIAVADALVEAYQHPAVTTGVLRTEAESRSVTLGINLVRGAFVGRFTADSEKFDGQKFHRYIEVALQRARNLSEQAEPFDPALKVTA
jgi:hypothetical protein